MTDYTNVYDKYIDECRRFVRAYLNSSRGNSRDIMLQVHHEVNEMAHLFNLYDNDSPITYYSDLIEKLDNALTSGLGDLIWAMLSESGVRCTNCFCQGKETDRRYREVDLVIGPSGQSKGLIFVSNDSQKVRQAVDAMKQVPEEISRLLIVVSSRSREALCPLPQPTNPKVCIVTLGELFDDLFPGEFSIFLTKVEGISKEVRDEIAIGVVEAPTKARMEHIESEFLSSLNEELRDMRPRLLSGTCLSGERVAPLDSSLVNELYDNFHKHGRDKILIGSADFARSFVSSEWLFGIHRVTQELEQTGTAVGYLKSVEQLLYRIALLHNDETYVMRKLKGEDTATFHWDDRFPSPEHLGLWSLIDFFSEEYNLGLLCINSPFDDLFQSVLHQFRKEDRNKYLHKKNLIGSEGFKRLSNLREKVQLIYLLVIGGCSMTEDDLVKLGATKVEDPDCIEDVIIDWARDIVELPSFRRDVLDAQSASIRICVNTDVPGARKYLGLSSCEEWDLMLTLSSNCPKVGQLTLNSTYSLPFKCHGKETWEHMASLVKHAFENALENAVKTDSMIRSLPVEVTYLRYDHATKQPWSFRLSGPRGDESQERTHLVLKGNSHRQRRKADENNCS